MTDLKISQFANGGAIQATDEVAAVRAGVNTKVTFGTMAAEDASDYTPTAGLGTMAFEDSGDYTPTSGLGTAAFEDTGASGNAVPLLDGDNTWSGKQTTLASDTAKAGLNLPHGNAPTSPVDGDLWTTTSGVFARINNATIQLDSTGVSIPYTPASASGAASLDFAEDTDNGSNKVILIGQASLASDVTVTLPDTTGTLALNPTPTSWTPSMTWATPGDFSVAYSTRVGGYIQIGKLIIAWFDIVTSTFTWSTASGAFRLSGLPFAAGADAYGAIGSFNNFSGATYTQMGYKIVSGQTYMEFSLSAPGVALTTVSTGSAVSGTQKTLRATVMYYTS